MTVKRYLDSSKRDPIARFGDYGIWLEIDAAEGPGYKEEYKDHFSILAGVEFEDKNPDHNSGWEYKIVEIDSLCVRFLLNGDKTCPPKVKPLRTKNVIYYGKLLGPVYQWQAVPISKEMRSIEVSFLAQLRNTRTDQVLKSMWFEDTLQRVHQKRLHLVK